MLRRHTARGHPRCPPTTDPTMHDVLRQRLLRKIESLPDEQIYQVLDFIEFLESKYVEAPPVEASGLQKFAENLEDRLRRRAVSPATIREAFQLISSADRVLSGVSSAGKRILAELNDALERPPDAEAKDEGGEAEPEGGQAEPDAGAPEGGGEDRGTPPGT